MNADEKISCAKFFPEEALEDKDRIIRREAYRMLWYTKEALKDKAPDIRREAYRVLWYTKEALEDKDRDVRREAKLFLDMIVTE